MDPHKLYSGPTIQSRSAARRPAQDLVCQIICQIYLSHNFENLVRVESLESLLKILTEYHDVDHTILYVV